MAEGFVYILVSANSEFVKIGRTEKTPFHRLREINLSENYFGSGPWNVSDFRQVKDCVAIEAVLHNQFGSKRASTNTGADELFAVAPAEARRALDAIDPAMLVRAEVIDKLMVDRDFSLYLRKLFSLTGLPAWLGLQGAWVLVLYPSTGGGRYFTINIGKHEVAYSSLPFGNPPRSYHVVVMDILIRDFKAVTEWVNDHEGEIATARYASALARATSIGFAASFAEAEKFFSLDGVRRATIAYWNEALIGLRERGSLSPFARHHNYNAVSKIVNDLRRDEAIFEAKMAARRMSSSEPTESGG